MKAVSNEKLLQQLNWRYATKAFDPTRKISAEDWAVLEETLVLTPSSFGLQPWKFLVITDQATKEKLVPVSWGQQQPAQCSHMVVLAAKQKLGASEIDRFIKRTAEVRGTPVESLEGYRKVMLGALTNDAAQQRINDWAARQVYIALGSFMTAAAMLGIDTCPMEGLDAAKYDEVLGLTGSGYATVVACPAGYRATTDKYATAPKVRFPSGEVVHRI